MKQTLSLAVPVCVALFLALPASGQSAMDVAAAAAGGSVGAAGGKKLSEGITKIFGKAGNMLKKSSEQGTTGNSKLPRFFPTPGPKKDAAAPPADRHGARTATPALAETPTELATASPVAHRSQPAARIISTAEIESIQSGTERQQVVAQLGRPSASVFIPENGGREILQYRSQGHIVGSVRLTGGVVSDVETR